MKYKRNKPSSKYTHSSQSYGNRRKRGNLLTKIPSYVILITIVLFFIAKVLQLNSVSLPKALENTAAEVYLERVNKAIEYGGNFVSMVGQKGAQFVFEYLKSDDDKKEEKVFAQNTQQDAQEALSDALAQPEKTIDVFSPTMPCLGEISSPFGEREHPVNGESAFHNGIDIAVDAGTNILAIEDGVIHKSTYNQYSGNFIVIEHQDGYTSSYAHLRECRVTEGQSVKKGDIIGISGSTGMATGPHLHMEIRKDSLPVNPLELISD